MVATKHTITAPELAEVFMREVVRHHGVPKSIISDRGSVFPPTSGVRCGRKLGTRLSMSTAYHPQSDGQTERMNRTIEDMLRAYVNNQGDDWDEHLVAAEMAINNSVQASTGYTPYYLTYGQHPRMPIEGATGTGGAQGGQDQADARRGRDQVNQADGDGVNDGVNGGDGGGDGDGDGDGDGAGSSSAGVVRRDVIGCNPAANETVRRISEAVVKAKENLLAAQQRQARYADEKRRDRVFKVGDRVLLSTANLNTQERMAKLIPKWIGPYRVKRVVSRVAYELELPASVRIYPVVHVSQLRAYVDGGATFPSRECVLRPEPELLDTGEPAWEVEEVLDKRVRSVRGRRVTDYLVLWKGYPLEEATWEPASNLRAAQWSVDQYERRVREGWTSVRRTRRRCMQGVSKV